MPFSHVAARHPRIQSCIAPPPGMVVVEGRWAHRLLLDVSAAVDTVLWCPELGGDASLARAVARTAGAAFEVSARTMERVTHRRRGGGLASLVRLPRWGFDASRFGPDALVLIADGVEYAGNLGTLIRTVDACGGAALALTNRRARVDAAAVFTASRGTVLTTPVLEFDSVEAAARWCRAGGFVVHLASPAADTTYRDGSFAGRTAIVVGSEGEGIGPAWFEHPHSLVSIPMRGRADSLNVAVAAAVLMFAAAGGVESHSPD
ncbi:MAG TPA: TrmH family RNA methyltransferase [Stackebrandtia sp.]|jgi:TrmH family RNA methyltransferase|uniref:TrmH family RNA methyltransferase n=1 Tax=Stackebrandtia sp. TaxID=2023065 RepID=UPI002D3666E4|nr:TrmH family RNA methyltransferase [Stackebrandtia sp.]HZE37501.1 TrmH family RNA methyltransferase [Stackebrandtia sp.]